MNRTDYYLLTINNKKIKRKNTVKKSKYTPKDYIDLKSITKMFVIFAVLHLVKEDKLDLNDPIKKYADDFKYKSTVLDVINHSTGLNDSWYTFDEIRKKWVPSRLVKKYEKTKDIYQFTLNLKQKYPRGEYRYNNYSYNILCYIVKKISGVYIDEYLEKIYFNPNNISFKWIKRNKRPYGGYGLFIRIYSLQKLANTLIDFAKFVDIDKNKHFLEKIKITLGKEMTLYGHSGSGGQYIYFNIPDSVLLMRFMFGNPDNIQPKDIVTQPDLIDYTEKVYCRHYQNNSQKCYNRYIESRNKYIKLKHEHNL